MRIQSRFSAQTEFRIRKQFEIEDDEKLICGIYTKYHRNGFVFTDKRFYWNLETTIQRGPREAGQAIPVPSNILQTNIGNLGVEVLYKDKKKTKPDFLVLDSYIGKIKIRIDSTDVDDARFLRRIFIEYIARERFPYEYLKQAPLDSISFSFDSAIDFFKAKKEGWQAEEHAEKVEKKEKKQYIQTDRGNVKDLRTYFSARTRRRMTGQNLFRAIMRTVVDAFADLIFAAAMWIGIKPLLLYKTIYHQHTPFTNIIEGFGRIFFKADVTTRRLLAEQEVRGDVADFLLYRRNYIFAILIVAFIIIKVAVIISTCRGKKKILPFVLLGLNVLLCFILPVAFIPFIILVVASYIAMQFALGVTGYTLRFKLLAMLLLLFMEYYFLHLFGYPAFVDVIGALLQMLSLRAKWW